VQGIAEKSAMPGIDEGRNTGAQDVVAGYRRDITEQLHELFRPLSTLRLYSELKDQELLNMALVCELTAERIHAYLGVVQAAKEVQ